MEELIINTGEGIKQGVERSAELQRILNVLSSTQHVLNTAEILRRAQGEEHSMTLQTLFVLLAGALLGPVAGASSQLLYLGLGVAGVPVFAMGAAGLPWIFGPTGGYLMAFPVAAALVGWISGSEGRALRTAIALVVGSSVIFVMGAGWLSVVTDLGPGALFAVAVQPFLVGAVVKAGICFAATRRIGARGRRR